MLELCFKLIVVCAEIRKYHGINILEFDTCHFILCQNSEVRKFLYYFLYVLAERLNNINKITSETYSKKLKTMLYSKCYNMATRSALQNIKSSIFTIKYFHASVAARSNSTAASIIYNYGRYFICLLLKIQYSWCHILDKDPAPSFLHPETQNLLKSMTRMQFEKVFRKRSVKNNTVEYK